MAYQEVTKNDYAEQLIENARTGKLKPSLRTISIAFMHSVHM